jgi:hypothetical protein
LAVSLVVAYFFFVTMATKVTALLCAVLVVLCGMVYAGANNSLADCQAFAAKFSNSCNVTEGPLASIDSHPGTIITCPVTGSCAGTISGSNCLMPHKLCVTCSVVSGVTRMRVQVRKR